jgi:predicted HicB family RNase H-like nuclease
MLYNFNDYKIATFFDKEENEFGAYIEEIPSLSAFDKCRTGAIKMLEDIFNDYKEIQEEDNEPLPEPFGNRKYSGKLTLRLPKTLHQQLVERAKEDDVSINQEILYLLSLCINSRQCNRGNKSLLSEQVS